MQSSVRRFKSRGDKTLVLAPGFYHSIFRHDSKLERDAKLHAQVYNRTSSFYGSKPVIFIEINKAAFHLTTVHEGTPKKRECHIPNMLGYPQRCRALGR